MFRSWRKQLGFLVVAAIMSGVLFSSTQAASPPNIITYQGRVLNANGVPVSDTSLSMSFALYTASSGGTCVWSNSSASCASVTARAVTLTTGLFTENLGDTTNSYAAIGDAIFADNATLYLEVIIAGETLTPRRQITAAPYALNADTLDGIDSTVLQLFETGSSRTFEDDAPVIIGTNAALTYGSSGVGDLRVEDELEVMGDGYIDNDLVVGASTSSTETITNAAFSLSGNDLFVASDLGVEGTIYVDGTLDVVGAVSVGDVTCTDCLDFTELSDTLALDASTSIAMDGSESFTLTNGGTGNVVVNLSSTGDLVVQDNGSGVFTINDTGTIVFDGSITANTDVDFSLAGTENITLTNSTSTAEAVDLTVTAAGNDAIEVNLTLGDDADVDTVNALEVLVTSAATGDSDILRGVTIGDLSSAQAGVTETALVLGSGWDTNLNFADTTAVVAISDTGNLTLNDGTNTLLTLTDNSNAGDLVITGDFTAQGDNIDSAGAPLVLNATAADEVRVGTGTPGTATGAGDLYVTDALEVDGALDLAGTATVSDLSCTDCLDFTELSDTLALDASTSIAMDGSESFTLTNGGTGNVVVNLSSTGDLVVQDNGTAVLTIADDDVLSYATDLITTTAITFTGNSLTTGSLLSLSSTGLTTGSALSVTATNANTANTAARLSQFAFTNSQSTVANTDIAGLMLNFTNNPSVAGNTERVMQINNVATSNTTDNAISALLLLDNADTSITGSTVVTDAISITVSGTIADGIADAIDATDTNITNALNFGTNTLLGSTGSIDLSNFDVTGSSGTITTAGDLEVNGGDITSTGALNIAPGGLLTVTSTASTTNAFNVVANSLTSGNGLAVSSTGASTTGNLLSVTSASTGAFSNGGVRLNFTGAHTGSGLQIDDVATTGTVASLNGNSLTSGSGLAIASSSTAFTGSLESITLSGDNVANTGSLLSLSSSGASSIARALSIIVDSTGAASNGFVRFNFRGDHTNAGFQVNDVTTTGTAAAIIDNVITSGDLLSVSSSSTGAFGTDGAVDFTFTGAHTGTAVGITDDSASTGNILDISGDALTSGSGVAISSTSTGTTGSLLSVTSASTGAITNGLAYFNFTGATRTNIGFKIDDATATGQVMRINANSVTTGQVLRLSGNALDTDGSLLAISSSSANNFGSSNGAISISFSGAHTGYAFRIADNNTASGTVFAIETTSATESNALTSGVLLNVVTGSTSWTGNYVVRFASTGADGNVVRIQDSNGTCDHNPGAAAEAVSCSSDERLKMNIIDADPVLDEIMSLRIRQYDWRADGSHFDAGVVAQEALETSASDIVHMGEDGYYKVETYSSWKLLKGIQEVNAKVDAVIAEQNSASQVSADTLATLTMDGNISMAGNQILDIGRLIGLNNSWSITENGTFTTTGVYTTTIASNQGTNVDVYATMSPEVTLTLSGTTTLSGGQAVIEFEKIDPEYNDIITSLVAPKVLITSNGPTAMLYVSQKSNNGFSVQEVGGTTSGITFDWLVIAYRRGYEPTEAEEVEEQTINDEVFQEVINEEISAETEDTATDTNEVAIETPVEEVAGTEEVAPTEEVATEETSAPEAESMIEVEASVEPEAATLASEASLIE